jgi:hypothetical protein
MAMDTGRTVRRAVVCRLDIMSLIGQLATPDVRWHPGRYSSWYGGSDAELPDRVSTRLGGAGAKGTLGASTTTGRRAHLSVRPRRRSEAWNRASRRGRKVSM